MAERGVVISSYCTACEVLVHWQINAGSRGGIEPLDAESRSEFPCDHWRDHHAAVQAVAEADGPVEWSERMVVARRLTDHPRLMSTDPL